MKNTGDIQVLPHAPEFVSTMRDNTGDIFGMYFNVISICSIFYRVNFSKVFLQNKFVIDVGSG